MSTVDERAFRDAMDASLVGVAILDEDGTYRYVNDAHVDVYGYDDEEAFLGSTWRMCYDDDQLESVEAVFPALERDGEWRGELEATRADGERFSQELSLSTLDDGGLVCIVRDLSERRSHERDLAALNEATRGLMTASDREGVADTVLDIGRRVLDGAMLAVWFRAEDAARLDPVAAMTESRALSGDDEARVRPVEPTSREWVAFERGEPWFVEDYQSVPDDECANPDAPLGSVAVVPLGDHGILSAGRVDVNAFDSREQDVLRVLSLNVAAALDRAEREAELAAKNERLEEFASVVSHDLRNPLSVIQGSAELARETGDEHYIDEVLGAADRMERLVDDLLTLAREGETVGETRMVSLASVAGRAWNAVRTEGADLRIDTSDHVRADPDRLQGAFENLFRNSVEHAAPDDEAPTDRDVDVTVTVDVGEGCFFVADDGPGIPPAERDAVFEEGYTTNDDGTGFGLAIVERIANAHDWTVRLEASSDGGARFRFEGVAVES